MEEEKKEEEKDKKLELVELEKLKQHATYGELFTLLIDTGLVNEQGFRISGVGMVIGKLKNMCELQDKTNLKLHFIEKKLENN